MSTPRPRDLLRPLAAIGTSPPTTIMTTTFHEHQGTHNSSHPERYESDTPLNGSTFHYYGLPVVIPMSIAMVIFMVLAVLGNIMVILTIVRHRGMRTRTNMFIINLAVADILVAVLDMPFSLITIIKGDWIFGKAVCQFNGFTMALFLICSIHTLMYISIHKYISITRPFSRAMTPRRIRLMIAAAWLWSALCATGPLVGWNKIVYKEGASQCGPSIPKDMNGRTHSLFITFTNYIIPLAVMSFCYFHIFKEIHVHMRHIRETFDMNRDNSVSQQKKISVTLFFVLACFLLCWTPFVVYSTTVAFMKDKTKMPVIANPLAYWCGYMNSACNPIIYAFRSPSFRQGYKEIMCRRPISSLSAEHSLSFRSRSARGSVKSTSNATGNTCGTLKSRPDSKEKRPPRRIPFLSQTSWMSLPFIPFNPRSPGGTSGGSWKNKRKISEKGSSTISGQNFSVVKEDTDEYTIKEKKLSLDKNEVSNNKCESISEDNEEVFDNSQSESSNKVNEDHFPKIECTMQMSMGSIQEENESVSVEASDK